MIIAVDFDGTCVKHKYPLIGEDIGAQPVLKRLIKYKHKLILFTMRSGDQLIEAIKWFQSNDIPLHGVNSNPGQHTWTKSPKAYANLYIDDAALGCPLTLNKEDKDNDKPYVNWEFVEDMLTDKGLFL